MNIGERIRNLRNAKNMTVTELAKNSFISQSYLSDIESGRTIPSLDKLMILCEQLGITMSEFFDEELDKSEDIVRLIDIAEKLSEEEIGALNHFLEMIVNRKVSR